MSDHFKETLQRIGRNFEVVKGEWYMWRKDQARNLARLKKPSLNPSDREHFVPHVLVAFIETTYDELPRTLTYITVAGLFVWVGVLLA